MSKINSLADLRKMKEELHHKIALREYCDEPEKVVQIAIGMATCGIAAGAKQTVEFFIEEFEKRNIPAVITQMGCLGDCTKDPVVQMTLPGKEPVVFEKIDSREKVIEILSHS